MKSIFYKLILTFLIFASPLSSFAQALKINETKSSLTYNLSTTGFVFKRKKLPMKGDLDLDNDSINKLDMTINFTSKNPFFRKFIDYDQYPEIIFSSVNNKATIKEDGLTYLEGQLTFHGVTKDIKVELQKHTNPNTDSHYITGNLDIKMSDFGLNPPRFLFFQVDDVIRTKIELYSQSI